ncbi:MAG TPA: hypothetical protein PLS71_18795, partial [Leptospiraceae bacterium]|nr:hypothetical protein [Leptospiraceae bacterium]
MRNFVKESIAETLQTTGFKLDEMTPLESILFRKNILGKFTGGQDFRTLWEVTVGSDFSVCDRNAWQWLDEFLLLDEFYLFFDTVDDPTINIFHENQSFTKFLSEFDGYVFYLTNKNLDFLISFNDSHYLTAHGTAEPWLRNKVKELSKTGWTDASGKS